MKDKDDSYIAAQIISDIRTIMNGYPTLTNITACFNVMAGLLNICSVRMRKKSLIKIADDFHQGMVDHIETLFEEKK